MSLSSTPFRPFDLTDDVAYGRWREWKLADYPASADDLLVRVRNPARLDAAEKDQLLARCCKASAAIYEMSDGDFADKDLVRNLGYQFGLLRLDRNLRADEDSISSLRVMPEAGSNHYIPYTSRPLNWHTDGYYNTLYALYGTYPEYCLEG